VQDPLRAVLPLPLHTTALTPQQLSAIFGSLATITLESLPEPLPALAPSMDELRALKAARAAEKDKEMGYDAGDEKDKQEDKDKAEDKEDKEETPELHEFDQDTLYVAIGTTDSTVVYYKLSRGIKKPHDIPDE